MELICKPTASKIGDGDLSALWALILHFVKKVDCPNDSLPTGRQVQKV